MKRIVRVVLTGGPCSGKTSSLKYLKEYYIERGWAVFTVPESATILFESGISDRDGTMTTPEFQENVAKMQKMHEEFYFKEAEALRADKVLILHDRGIIDGGAYMPLKDFYPMIEKVYGESIYNVVSRYDIIIHLVTTAIGAPDFYSYNNPMRKETPEQAAEKDQKTENAWSIFDNFVKIDNSTNFSKKLIKISDIINSEINKTEKTYPEKGDAASLPLYAMEKKVKIEDAKVKLTEMYKEGKIEKDTYEELFGYLTIVSDPTTLPIKE